jgi:hypothetical protein
MKLEKFFKQLEDLGYISESGHITLNIKGLKDWPKNLDTENWEIDSVSNGSGDKDSGHISGYAGGDWQDEARFNIVFEENKNPRVIMYDDPGTCFTGEDIHKNIEKLYKEYKGNSLTESIFNNILHESIISDKEFVELYKKKRDVTKSEKAKMDDYINSNAEETIFCGTTWKYSMTYYFKKVGNAYFQIYFDDVHKIGEYNPNMWSKKLLRDGKINMYGIHFSIGHVSFDHNNDPNTGMNSTLWS